MSTIPENQVNIASRFPGEMAGGAFAYRVEEGFPILYASDGLIRLFGCTDFTDFMTFVGGSFDGVVDETQRGTIQKEFELQRKDGAKTFGYAFYHIRTKTGHLRRVVNHWTYLEEENLVLSQIFLHRLENVGSELDPITGLYGNVRFHTYVDGVNRQFRSSNQEEFVIVYLNLLRFKVLNLRRGEAEGDACLRATADTLSCSFPDAFIARIGDDHFAVFVKAEGVKDRIEMMLELFHERYGERFNVTLKFGIYRFFLGDDFYVETALSRAKVACDAIKEDALNHMMLYTDDLEKEVEIRYHVISRINEAIEQGWIKLYYQPVIRSVTGELCGTECLVRWIDPEVGFLNPGQFIGILEYAQLIHRLDCYVVEEVCRTIRERSDRKEPMVPVSVNFSRLDFQMCDMLKVVENAVKRYGIPRDALHIEITESMIASDEELMRRVIDSFRGAGFEIWMDDFGSGYSSLNLLKDYSFDMLKLDMRFLSPFTETSRSIIRSAVTMAKDIGLKTLAEGVETKEQLDFLREIGCEQIQGFYYGKPEPIEEMFAHLKEKNIGIELRKWRRFYETAGFHIRSTDAPLEIVEISGNEYKTLFMNQAYREQILPEKQPVSLEEIDRIIYQNPSPLHRKYDDIVDALRGTKEERVFYYTGNNVYLRFRGRILVERGKRAIMAGSILRLNLDQDASAAQLLSTKLRELNLLFEVVLLMNTEKNTALSLLSGFQQGKDRVDDVYTDMRESTGFLIQKLGHPTDRQRMQDFLDADTMAERVAESRKGYISDVFRLKQADGSYEWKEIFLLLMPETEGKEFLYCLRSYEIHSFKTEDKTDQPDLTGIFETANLWKNLLWSSDIRFFWKDKEMRYRVVSQSFLDFFGFDSVSDIIGKTDEELRWLLNEEEYQRNELACLGSGERRMNASVQVVVKGVVRHLIGNIMPVYKDNEIVGIAGYFTDPDEEMGKISGSRESLRTDPVTKLMGSHAFAEALMEYADLYWENRVDFGLILIRNLHYQRILDTYGEPLSNRVLEEMAKRLVVFSGKASVLSRIRDSLFAVLLYSEDLEELKKTAQQIQKALDDIREVDGCAVTIQTEYACHRRSDTGMTIAGLYETTLKELAEEAT